jgi:hypothetical protein
MGRRINSTSFTAPMHGRRAEDEEEALCSPGNLPHEYIISRPGLALSAETLGTGIPGTNRSHLIPAPSVLVRQKWCVPEAEVCRYGPKEGLGSGVTERHEWRCRASTADRARV